MDHPRSRGEHLSRIAGVPVHSGSSPLARGALFVMAIVILLAWIIPARAGSTRGPRTARVCRLGSSPLARGAPFEVSHRGEVTGIIPARAGSTILGRLVLGSFRDHPRSRGEHSAVSGPSMPMLGSSPLARGALRQGVLARDFERIIPARAGSTFWKLVIMWDALDHPRSRGEHESSSRSSWSAIGSSPLARGARNPMNLGGARRGIIPARAGSTRTFRF